MSKFNFIIKELSRKNVKIKGYFDKKNDMYIIFWYSFVVGKYQRKLFDNISRWVIIKQCQKIIDRIKILYSNDIKTAKFLK